MGRHSFEPPVAVVVFIEWHEYQREKRHDRLDQAELQRRLLAEPEEFDGVLLARQATRECHVIRRPKCE